MQGEDHGTTRQEKKGFKECVGHQMKNCRRPSSHTKRHDHVPDLTHGRKCEHPFDVGLHERRK